MGYLDNMDLDMARDILDGLNCCLPRTPSEDRGCGACPYGTRCRPGERLIGLPAQLIDEIRQLLEQAVRGHKKKGEKA